MLFRGDEDSKKSPWTNLKETFETAGKVFFLTAIIISVVLAAQSIYKLTQEPITLATLLPAMGNLLPFAAIGYIGAVRLVTAAVRLIRIVLSVPIVLGGSYYLLPELPKLFHNSPDLTTTSIFALLATPEVLEVLIVLSVLGTLLFWIGKVVIGTVSSLIQSSREDRSE